MSYFGHLKDIQFNKKNQSDVIDVLMKEGLFIAADRIKSSGFKDGILDFDYSTLTKCIEPTEEFRDEFYFFIIKICKNDIDKEKMLFFKSFNEEIYGLDKINQKNIGLKYFKKLYDEIYLDEITFFTEQKSYNGIVHSVNFSKLEMLYYQYNTFKSNLFYKIKANKYLDGDHNYFAKENLQKKYDLSEEINFETKLQILVELNDRFIFEEDLFFAEIRFDKAVFKKYREIFTTLESYQFANKKINSFLENKKANIESLYEVLINEKVIFDNKTSFMKFLKNEYDLVLTKIISYDKNVNYFHDERVVLFQEEWSNLASKKERN
ncbi:hypothetical protein [Flavobacterium sp.]|jgi:hypothetical protein|uniref:hypothetical protein n=1 Tax=Flavobacterium sp. TaxID=239 RepID=UPI0037BFE79C